MSAVIGFFFGVLVSFAIVLSNLVAMRFGKGLFGDALIRIGIFGALVLGAGEAVGFFFGAVVKQGLIYFWLSAAFGFFLVPFSFQLLHRRNKN